MSLEYQTGPIMDLHGNLQSFHGQLSEAGEAVRAAAVGLRQAWQENQALEGFDSAYSPWNTEYENTLSVLQRIAAAVESSLHHALQTDLGNKHLFGH